MGEIVDDVFLLDTEAPSLEPIKKDRYTSIAVLLKLVDIYEEMLGQSVELSKEILEPLNYGERLQALLIGMKKVGVLPSRASLSSVESLVRVFSAHVNTNYVPKSQFEGKILIFEPEEVMSEQQEKEPVDENGTEKNWQSYGTEVQYISVPGNHMTMLHRGNIEGVGRHISMTLE